MTNDRISEYNLSLENVGMEYPDLVSDRVSAVNPRTWKRRNLKASAIQGVSFKAKSGERVGIIGPNGAGKTTLLRLIAGVFRPSQGTVVVKGSVTHLLDSGFGLVPDLSGLTNARTYGIIHGLKGPNLERYIGESIDFADIGDAIRRPVSTYSTGMVMRLVFALSTAFKPDILVLDEALAAGDENFQIKATRKLTSFLNSAGTVVLSSHSEDFVRATCNRALVLNRGRILFDGDVHKAFREYRILSK